MNVLLLAAGLGTRLQPYTYSFAKPVIPFLNVPMGLYQFQYLKCLEKSISSFVVNTHHLPQQIEQLYSNQPYLNIKPKFSNETKKILGSGGAVKKAEALLTKNKSIILMNADEVYFNKDTTFLQKVMASHEQSKVLATLVVMDHPQAGLKFGALWSENDNDNKVKHIGKSAPQAHMKTQLKPWHYIGVCILSWEVMSYIKPEIEQNILYDVLFPYLDRLQIYKIQSQWFETGNKEDLLIAAKTMLTSLSTNHYLQNFINQYDDSQLIANSLTTSLISKSLNIDPKNLLGFNCISKSTVMNENSQFENSIAFADQLIVSDN